MADREVGTYREGDLIRASKGDAVIQGRLERSSLGDLRLSATGWPQSALEREGFDIELIEAAPDPLPTEPGYYLVTRNENGDDDEFWAFQNGDWFEVNTNPSVYTRPEGFQKIERLYTKAEVMAKYRAEANHVEPNWGYGGPLRVIYNRLEEAL